jgi:hypothetical protein
MVALTLPLASCELGSFEHHTAHMADGSILPDGCTPLPEICDGVDNDCDGLVDNDDPSLIANDVHNCGQCGNVCDLQNVEIHTCTNGQCGIAKCDDGYSDLNETAADGCESNCIKTMDWDPCDGVDNDCNGIVDDWFDLTSDPNNCGACDFRCSEQYSEAQYHVISFGCQVGQCRIAACAEGYYDRDGVLDDGQGNLGCEYACTIQYTVELCNGVDDDCDGLVDNNPVDRPACLTQGVCAGTQAVCDAQTGTWSCPYPSTYQLIEDDGLGCDGLDNDCDGQADEPFGVGGPCSAGQGACRRTGTYECNSQGTGSVCNAVPGTPDVEVCDGIDNDCDGQVDELDPSDPYFGQYGSFVYISTGNFTIFAHEASRPTATTASAGFGDNGKPCSKANVMPWSNITAVDEAPAGDVTARQACQRLGTGWDLCTDAQWYRACADGLLPTGGQAFPYGTTYVANTCNGYDFGVANGGIGPRRTGSLSSCYRSFSGARVHDLSGNLKEWVRVGTSGYEVRGGAYNSVSFNGSAPGLQCTGVSPMPAGEEIHLPSIGFRCCYPGSL